MKSGWELVSRELNMNLQCVAIECQGANKQHGATFASAHEAYGVILEEVEEFWEIVKLKRCKRDRSAMRRELIQIAAMAVKALASMDNFVEEGKSDGEEE